MLLVKGAKIPCRCQGQRSDLGDWLIKKNNEREQKLNEALLTIIVYIIPSVGSGHALGLRVRLFPLEWAEIATWKSSSSEDLPVSMRLHFVGFCKVFVYLARRTDGWDFRSDPSRRPTKLWYESLVRRPEKTTLHEERGAQALEEKTGLHAAKQW